VAPFWANFGRSPGGEVYYKVINDNDPLLATVSSFINAVTDDSGFVGDRMLVVMWNELQEFTRIDTTATSSRVSSLGGGEEKH
jgi:hypothetical protein